MIKKLRIKFVCINMTFVTIMLCFIMFTIIHFTKMNLEQDSLQMVNTLTEICLLIGLLSFFIFFIISILFANWAIRPVEQTWRYQKQFIADASHELKTPLTVIFTNAELLQSPDYDEEYKQSFSRNILSVATQMRNLVNGLLELSRVDNESFKASMESLNFSRLTEHSILLFEPLFFEQDRELEYQITPDIYITGVESHLKQVIAILLDNALKYSVPQTTVSVELQKQKKYCHLTVSNYGDPISPKDLTNIFKRFYRADSNRTSSDSYGLGLSIAQSIVIKHKGKIWAESIDGKNTFHVLLPF